MSDKGGMTIIEYSDIQKNWERILQRAKNVDYFGVDLYAALSQIDINNTSAAQFIEFLSKKCIRQAETPFAYKDGIFFYWGDNVYDDNKELPYIFCYDFPTVDFTTWGGGY